MADKNNTHGIWQSVKISCNYITEKTIMENNQQLARERQNQVRKGRKIKPIQSKIGRCGNRGRQSNPLRQVNLKTSLFTPSAPPHPLPSDGKGMEKNRQSAYIVWARGPLISLYQIRIFLYDIHLDISESDRRKCGSS